MEQKKVAVVTGGTRGMGQAISLQLAENGTIVYAVYHKNEESACQTKKLLQALTPECDVIKGDISNGQDVNRLVTKIGEKHGHIDILVNNAGIFDFRFIEDMDESYLDNMWNVNFKSQFFMMQAVLPYMKNSEYGRIINASSISSHFADVGLVGYAASKASVDMLTKISAAEFGPYNITVNAYAPGIIHTDMTHQMIEERGDIQVKDIALNRFGASSEVGALVGFLASKDAGYITGETIGIDGGMFKVQNAYLAYKRKSEKE